MQWNNVPGYSKSKGNINKDDISLQHELLKLNREIARLDKRRLEIRKLIKKANPYLKEEWFDKTIHLYVLELEQGKYYVGMTRNIQKRYARHLRGKGANWTKKYAPISIIKTIDTKLTDENEVAILENELTFDMAIQYGLDNVRGGGYCQAFPKWPQHLYDAVFSGDLVR